MFGAFVSSYITLHLHYGSSSEWLPSAPCLIMAHMTIKRQTRHLISMRMSHLITLIALSLCRRSLYTLELMRVWVGCAFPGCLGKCHRRQKEKWRGGKSAGVDIDLPFILMHTVWLTHLQCGKCGSSHVCMSSGVCGPVCFFVRELCICVWALQSIAAQHVSNSFWDAFFLIISQVSPMRSERQCAPSSAEIDLPTWLAIFFTYSLMWEMQALWALKKINQK